MKSCTILEDFFLLDSVNYRNDVMITLKFEWFNLKILMWGWYRKLTSSCVSFTTYQQCHSDIEGDVTPTSLQYQNVHWIKNYALYTELIYYVYLAEFLKFKHIAAICNKPVNSYKKNVIENRHLQHMQFQLLSFAQSNLGKLKENFSVYRNDKAFQDDSPFR